MPEIDLNTPILPGVENRTIVVNDNLPALRALPDACIDLIYLDPPFNSGRAYLNPIGLAEQEERGLLQDIRLPAPMERREPAPAQERLVGFVDVFTMEPGDPNWKVEWIEEIGQVIPALPPILEGAGRAHSPSMQGYLTFMAVRLVEMQRILKPTGSIYLHCDDTSGHYLKAVMDSVFGSARFLNNLIWKRATSHNDARRYGRITDYILFYANGDDYTWNGEAIKERKTTAAIRRAYPSQDERGRYRSSDLTGDQPSDGESGLPWRDYNVAALGRHWAAPLTGDYADYIEATFIPGYTAIEGVHARLDALDAAGLIHHPKRGKWPGLKRYADADLGNPQQNLILDPIGFTNYSTRLPEYTGYPTQKPLALLNRIIEASSDKGDVVLDPFCGCATACVAAEQLERRWIGMDMGAEAYRQVVKRLRGTFPEMEVEGAAAGLSDGKRAHKVNQLPGQTDEPIRPVSAEAEAAAASRRQWTLAERRDLYGRQEGYCLGCGVRTDLRLMHVDHVVPDSKKGPDVMANAQLLCGHCNDRKGVKTMPELWRMTRDKGLLVNQRQVELLYRERDAERMADDAMMRPGIRELWQLPQA